jgi:hypothetical protein
MAAVELRGITEVAQDRRRRRSGWPGRPAVGPVPTAGEMEVVVVAAGEMEWWWWRWLGCSSLYPHLFQ